jgi:hypothetical protein
VDEEAEVVAAVSRQLVDFRDRYNLLKGDMRDGSVTARRTPAVIWDLPGPPGDGDQGSGVGGPVSPRGKVAIAVNVEDLLAAVSMSSVGCEVLELIGGVVYVVERGNLGDAEFCEGAEQELMEGLQLWRSKSSSKSSIDTSTIDCESS